MLDNEKQRNLYRFQSLLSKNKRNARSVNVVDLLRKIYGTFIDNRVSALQLCVDDSLQPRTDGKTIIVSLIPDFLKDEYSDEDWLIVLKAALAHESQHVNSSNFKDIKTIREWYGDLLEKEAGVDKCIGAKIGKNILNIIEDGRIEAIAVQRRPGMFLPFMYLNQVIREGTAVEKVADNESDEFCDFANNILSYAKTGLYSPGIEVYAETRLEENFFKIESLIDKGVNARTSNECCTTVMELLEIITPYIKELIQNEELQQQINQLSSPNEYSSNNESQYGDGSASTLRSNSSNDDENENREQNNKKQDGSNQSGDNSKDQPKDDGKDQSSGVQQKSKKNKKQDENDQSDADGKEQTGSNGSNQEPKEQTLGVNSQERKEDEHQAENDGQGEENRPDCVNNENTNHKQSKSFSNAKKAAPLSDERLDEIRKEMSRQLKTSPQPKPKSSGVLDKKSLKRVASVFNKTGDDLIETEAQIPIVAELPVEMKAQARQLRREIQKIVDARKNTSKNLRRGTLNTTDLWKVGLHEETIFERKTTINKNSIAFYLLIDNSGSMGESCLGTLRKFEAARSAAAVIEEAAKSLLPCKIALFHDSINTFHTIIKDFDEKRKGNFSWNSMKTIMPSDSNADSVNIRVATEELSRRREARKILFVLSDGLPSAYGSEENASREVRQAVKDARSKGIVVIPIMFGNDKIRQTLLKTYQEMYEKNLISCRPQEIINTLVKTFRLVLTR